MMMSSQTWQNFQILLHQPYKGTLVTSASENTGHTLHHDTVQSMCHDNSRDLVIHFEQFCLTSENKFEVFNCQRKLDKNKVILYSAMCLVIY